jgi:hypothetical protein
MHITAEEISSRCRRCKGIGSCRRSGNYLTDKDWGSSARVIINSEVMRNAAIHIVEVNGYRRPGRNGNSTHVKGEVLSYQIDSG